MSEDLYKVITIQQEHLNKVLKDLRKSKAREKGLLKNETELRHLYMDTREDFRAKCKEVEALQRELLKLNNPDIDIPKDGYISEEQANELLNGGNDE